jgi:flagellar hook protein FlgE
VRFNAVTGVSANASTMALLVSGDYRNSGSMQVSVNGVMFTSTSLQNLANDITNTSLLPAVAAVMNSDGDLEVSDSAGNDLVFSITSANSLDTLGVLGPNGRVVRLDLTGGDTAVSVGGTVGFTLSDGITLSDPVPDLTGLFGSFQEQNFTAIEFSGFDPSIPDTYNFVVVLPVYDSLELEHDLKLFFVKERYRPLELGSYPNRWTLYVQVDGQNVGESDPTLPPPLNTVPTQAGFTVQFDEIGQLIEADTDVMHVTNWTPINELGNPNGALGPLLLLRGATLPIPNPPVSSNFVIDLTGTMMLREFYVLESAIVNGELVLDDAVDLACGAN